MSTEHRTRVICIPTARGELLCPSCFNIAREMDGATFDATSAIPESEWTTAETEGLALVACESCRAECWADEDLAALWSVADRCCESGRLEPMGGGLFAAQVPVGAGRVALVTNHNNEDGVEVAFYVLAELESGGDPYGGPGEVTVDEAARVIGAERVRLWKGGRV